MELQHVVRASAADAVFDQLAGSILSGEVEAGEPLPSERALAEALGVSRPVVREALQRLSHAGLLRIRHGGATRVSDFRRTAGPELLGVLLQDRNGELDVTVARSIVEARAALGPVVADAAARRATAEHLAAMTVALGSLRDAADTGAQQRAALDLWDRVVDATGNVVYRLLFNALRSAYEPVMDALAVVVRDEVADIDGHAAVVEAIASGDPDGAAAAVRAVTGPGTTAAVAVIDDLLAAPDPT